MARPELIALDLDGTLLDARHRIPARAAAALDVLRADGVEAILLTGRPPRMTRAYLDELGLEHAIVFNGASRFDRTPGACEHHHQLDADASRAIVARLRAVLPGIELGLETHHGWYLDPGLDARRRTRPRLDAADPTGVGAVEDFIRDAVIKVFARHPEHEVPAMAAALAGLDVYATWSGAGLLEVMHPQVNKRDALARFAAERGVRREAVAAFGDHQNDVEVLAWAGHGVAVANATPEARAVADELTAAHDEDGVALVLERWLRSS